MSRSLSHHRFASPLSSANFQHSLAPFFAKLPSSLASPGGYYRRGDRSNTPRDLRPLRRTEFRRRYRERDTRTPFLSSSTIPRLATTPLVGNHTNCGTRNTFGGGSRAPLPLVRPSTGHVPVNFPPSSSPVVHLSTASGYARARLEIARLDRSYASRGGEKERKEMAKRRETRSRPVSGSSGWTTYRLAGGGARRHDSVASYERRERPHQTTPLVGARTLSPPPPHPTFASSAPPSLLPASAPPTQY